MIDKLKNYRHYTVIYKIINYKTNRNKKYKLLTK